MVALMAKRVYDVAGVLNKGCKVTTPVVLSSPATMSLSLLCTQLSLNADLQ